MLKLVASIAVVLSFVGLLPAQEAEKSATSLFDRIDTNADGKLTRDELGESKATLFDRLLKLYDKNQDGILTKAEFEEGLSSADEARPAERPGAERNPDQPFSDPKAIFANLDKNSDGQLELQELPRLLQERLGPAYTTLGKNSLTVEEFSSAFRVLFPEHREQPGLQSVQAFFGRFDVNKDDIITLEEIPAEFRPRLKEQLDQLKAEYLTREDYLKLIEHSRRSAETPAAPAQAETQGTTAGNETESRAGFNFMGRPPGDDGQRPGPSFFGLLDTNRDGKLSSSELSQAPQLLAQLDRNGDSLLDPSEIFGGGRFGQVGPVRGRYEMTDGGENRIIRPQRPAIDDEPKTDTETPQPETTTPLRPRQNLRNVSNFDFTEQIFGRYDEDRDGKLSAAEAPPQVRRNFERIDLDADGSVSKDELTKALESRNR